MENRKRHKTLEENIEDLKRELKKLISTVFKKNIIAKVALTMFILDTILIIIDMYFFK